MRSLNLFNGLLPADLVRTLLQWLQVQGPVVKLIDGEPSEEQKNAVTAVVFDEQGKPDVQRPDLSIYHLIANDFDESGRIVYCIGFCQRLEGGSLAYQIKVLDEKSSLLRYVREDLQHPEYSKLFPYDLATNTYQQNSRDRLLLKYLEFEIKTAGGLTQHSLRNRTRLAAVCKDTQAWMNGCYARTNQQAFKNSIKQVMCEDAAYHIVYGEEEEAMDILKTDLSLVLSSHTVSVTSCAPEIEYLPLPLFQLMVITGDWFMAKRTVRAVTESSTLSDEEKLNYQYDLLKLLTWAEEGKTQIRFNNLLNKGVQILDGNTLETHVEERERYEADVVKRNAYHLIIKTEEKEGERLVVSCMLGYRDPKTPAYRQYDIPIEDELFKIAPKLYKSLKTANDGHGASHEHFFTRSNRDLALVNSTLKELGVETQWKESITGQEFDALLGYLDFRIKQWVHWSVDRKQEQWHGEISAELRLFPAILWQFWVSGENSWSLNEEEVSAYLNCPIRLPLDKNFYGDPIFPVPSFLGDKFHATGPARFIDGVGTPGFLKSIMEIEQQELRNLSEFLQINLDLKMTCDARVVQNVK